MLRHPSVAALERPARLLACLAVLSLLTPARADTLSAPSASFPTIQDALDAAQPGDLVKIKSGHYEESLVLTTPGVTVKGSDSIVDASSASFCIDVTADDVTLDGLVLINATEVAVKVVGNRFTLRKCTLRRSAKGAEIFSDDALVSGCTFTALRDDAIVYEPLTDVADSLSDSRFEKNTFERIQSNPIEARGGRLVVVSNRADVFGSPFSLYPTHPTQASRVAKNRIRLADGSAMEVGIDNAAGVIIEDNVIRAAGGVGFEVDLTNSGDSVIQDNSVKIAGRGINVDVEEGALVRVRDNQIQGIRNQGICADGDSIVIRGNDVRDCEDEGIDLDGNEGQVLENRVRDVGEQGLFVRGNDALIKDNQVKVAMLDGIRVEGDFNEIRGNKVSQVDGDGIDIAQGFENSVIGNRCDKNGHEGIDNSGIDTFIEQNRCLKNARSLGPDIAGQGNGNGTVAVFSANTFKTGGRDVPQRNEEVVP